MLAAAVDIARRRLHPTPAERAALDERLETLCGRPDAAVDDEVRALLVRGATPSPAALHAAARSDKAAAVALLLSAGVAPDQLLNGETPLHAACGVPAPGAARVLLDHGADAEAPNARGQTPRDVARRGWRDGWRSAARAIDEAARHVARSAELEGGRPASSRFLCGFVC